VDTIPETARLTADMVVLSANEHNEPHILLIKRRWNPYEGHWALPGGHVDAGEDTEAAAVRELKEETGITATLVDYVDAYATPGRDPRGRYVTFAYVAELDNMQQPTAADDAAEAAWMPLDDVLADGFPLAFDHRQIIRDALAKHTSKNR
jgi:8-oxo-dGTP diphosphatase